MRVRLPLRRVMLPILHDHFKEDVEQVKDLILAEVNVKEIEYISGTSGIVSKKAKPNFKTLGKRLGKQMKAAAELIQAFDQEAIAIFENTGQLSLNIEGQIVELVKEDIEIYSEDIPGWQVASEDGITVALDIHLDDELIAEGTARELVNRIQNLRKNSGLNVTDRIRVAIEEKPIVEIAIEKYGEYIMDETLADDIEIVRNGSSLHQLIPVEWLEGDSIGMEIRKSE